MSIPADDDEFLAKAFGIELPPRCSNGDIKYPEDIWRAARPIATGYDEAMQISALLVAERKRCAALARAKAADWRKAGSDLHSAEDDRTEGAERQMEAQAAAADWLARAIEEGRQP